MGKQNWTEVEFADCVAMATNPVNANKKFAKRIKNMHSHIKPGALVLRKGYGLKYAVPSNDRITNGSFINFDMFWDRQAVEAGQEITCQAQKGTVIALAGSSVTDTQNMLCFWCRPYWNGSSWVDEWQWINETIITKITTATDAVNKSMIVIWGATNQGIAGDSLVGYTIYNKTKNQFAKIITNKVEDGNHTRINHTLFNSDWAINDVLILSRSWLDLAYHEELYTLGREDYAYHRILHDLRIGFGGQENRPGLAVGYRKNYLLLNSIDWTALHTDITPAAIEAFAKTEGFIITPHTIDSQSLVDTYGMTYTLDTGSLTADTYNFKLIGIIDGFQHQQIAKLDITVENGSKINISPFIKLAKDNNRLTGLDIYASRDDITFNRIRQYTIRDKEFAPSNWKLDEFGKMVLFDEAETSVELFNDGNAARIVDQINSIGLWEKYLNEDYTTLEVVADGAGGSSLGLKLTQPNNSFAGVCIPIPNLKKNTEYNISLYLKADSPANVIIGLMDTSKNIFNSPQVNIPLITTSYVEYTANIISGNNGALYFAVIHMALVSFQFYIDYISITEKNTIGIDEDDLINATEELNVTIGYTATFDMVKGWDQALNYRGRTYYLNPFVDKRYNNFLLVSAIHSNNSFMYDIASFSNFRELATADSNKAIGMVKLNNGAFLILKDLSLMIIDPDTGVEVETIYGVSCISRNSIDNANGIIRFCGEEEIYYFDTSRGAIPTLKNTIRDLYLAIPNKDKIFGIRDKFNNYRIRIDNTITKTEYLFTEDGPIEEEKELFAEIYRIDARGDLNFLNSGNIYLVDPDIVAYLLDDSGNWLLDDSGQTIV